MNKRYKTFTGCKNVPVLRKLSIIVKRLKVTKSVYLSAITAALGLNLWCVDSLLEFLYFNDIVKVHSFEFELS